MRTTAAKAAVLGGYRNTVDAVTAARRAFGSFNATVSAAPPIDGLPLANALSCENDRTDMLVASDFQRPAWGIDDWILAGGEEELLDPMYPAPRLLFGPVPTIEEAKAATAELKEAVEKVYFSSCYPSDSTVGDLEVSLQSPVCLESSVTKCCTMNENSEISSTPNHVIQMFSWLQGNPEAQNIVASVASDENVWNAVMNNPKVKEFYGTQQSEPIKSSESSEAHSSQDSCQSSGTRFTDFMQNFKLKVLKMVGNLSDFFEDYMRTSTAGHSTMDTEAHHPVPYAAVVQKSVVALVIATILVILLKRG